MLMQSIADCERVRLSSAGTQNRPMSSKIPPITTRKSEIHHGSWFKSWFKSWQIKWWTTKISWFIWFIIPIQLMNCLSNHGHSMNRVISQCWGSPLLQLALRLISLCQGCLTWRCSAVGKSPSLMVESNPCVQWFCMCMNSMKIISVVCQTTLC